MKRLLVVVSLVVVMFGVVGPMVQTANAGSIIRLSRSPDRNQYEASDILMIECEMDVDGTTRWWVENLTTGAAWIKHETGSKVNQERLVLSELVSGSGNQTIRVTCEGRFGDGGWDGPNVARASMEFSVNVGSGGSTPSSGGMDFNQYCLDRGYNRADTGNDSNAFTWVCVDGNRESSLDLYELCSWQYGGQLPYPGLDDPYNPYDWACYRDQHQVAQMPAAPPASNPEPQPEQQPQPQPEQQTDPQSPAPVQSQPDSNSNSSGNNQRNTNLSNGDYAIVTYSPSHDRVSLRECAGTGCGEIRRLNLGEVGRVVGGPTNADGYTWIQLNIDGQVGWAAIGDSNRAWITITSAPSSSNNSNDSGNWVSVPSNSGSNTSGGGFQNGAIVGVVYSPSFDRVNCRSGAGTSYSIVRELSEGETGRMIDGPTQSGGYTWVKLDIGGSQCWAVTGDSSRAWLEPSGNSGGSSQSIVTVPVSYFGQTYNFQVNTNTCAIVNGLDIVAQEINRSYAWMENEYANQSWVNADAALIFYLMNDGEIDTFRFRIDSAIVRQTGCMNSYYQIGSHTMDLNGLGNVLFGYYSIVIPNLAAHSIADLDQISEDHRRDFSDDARQIDWGQAIAHSGAAVTPDNIESLIPSNFVDGR